MATLAQIAASIRRVRFSEEGFGKTDQKVVWHQGIDGCEVFTRVDRQGKVVEQELDLRSGVIVWHRERPVRTGRLRTEPLPDGDRGTNPRAARWDLDSELDRDLLELAIDFAGRVRGDDSYLTHLGQALRAALENAPADLGAVTRTATAAQRAAIAPEPKKPAGVLGWLKTRLTTRR